MSRRHTMQVRRGITHPSQNQGTFGFGEGLVSRKESALIFVIPCLLLGHQELRPNGSLAGAQSANHSRNGHNAALQPQFTAVASGRLLKSARRNQKDRIILETS